MTAKNIKPIRLRLELKSNYLSHFDQVMLKRYGESTTGNSIIRDIIIPSDMPLHNLHYAIQKVFGWQNSHLRRFILHEDLYQALTRGTVKGWTDLVGVLFQPPSEGESDLFWDDNYDPYSNRSILTWLKGKIKGPYNYGGHYEHFENAKEDIEDIVNNPHEFEIRESFSSYYKRKQVDETAEVRVLGRKRFIDMTLEELNQSVAIENGTENLLERLLVDDVIAYTNQELNKDEIFPVTNELIYNYDFGDNWEVTITKHDNYDDLLEKHLVFLEEISEIEQLVLKNYKPYCIHRDGISVMDDVGGLSGYANFLGDKYEQTNLDHDLRDINAWATSMGWRPTKTVPKELL